MADRVVHCWEDNGDGTATCMLLDGHAGPHEWTPDRDIFIEFKVEPQNVDGASPDE